MRELAAFPTWALTIAIVPLLSKSHPWHGRSFTLRDWHAHQTPLCRVLDVLLYFSIASFAVTMALVFTR
jgi:hypothetical protein